MDKEAKWSGKNAVSWTTSEIYESTGRKDTIAPDEIGYLHNV